MADFQTVQCGKKCFLGGPYKVHTSSEPPNLHNDEAIAES